MRPLRTSALVLLFWCVAALLVLTAHALSFSSSLTGVVVKTAAIIVAAFLYVRVAAPDATVDHALLVGITWLMLDIGAEIFATAHGGRGWFDLIGSGERTLTRDVLLLAWLAAPAMLVRREALRNH